MHERLGLVARPAEPTGGQPTGTGLNGAPQTSGRPPQGRGPVRPQSRLPGARLQQRRRHAAALRSTLTQRPAVTGAAGCPARWLAAAETSSSDAGKWNARGTYTSTRTGARSSGAPHRRPGPELPRGRCPMASRMRRWRRSRACGLPKWSGRRHRRTSATATEPLPMPRWGLCGGGGGRARRPGRGAGGRGGGTGGGGRAPPLRPVAEALASLQEQIASEMAAGQQTKLEAQQAEAEAEAEAEAGGGGGGGAGEAEAEPEAEGEDAPAEAEAETTEPGRMWCTSSADCGIRRTWRPSSAAMWDVVSTCACPSARTRPWCPGGRGAGGDRRDAPTSRMCWWGA